ncbi:hypothetical protein Tco_0055818, partial [Tanacetum coccineum]
MVVSTPPWDWFSSMEALHQMFSLGSRSGHKLSESKLMGIDTRPKEVDASAKAMGCLIFTTPFVHLELRLE